MLLITTSVLGIPNDAPAWLIPMITQAVTAAIVPMETRINARIDGIETGINARMDAMETRTNARIDGIETKVDTLATKFNQLATRVNQLGTKVNQLESTVEELKESVVLSRTEARARDQRQSARVSCKFEPTCLGQRFAWCSQLLSLSGLFIQARNQHRGQDDPNISAIQDDMGRFFPPSPVGHYLFFAPLGPSSPPFFFDSDVFFPCSFSQVNEPAYREIASREQITKMLAPELKARLQAFGETAPRTAEERRDRLIQLHFH